MTNGVWAALLIVALLLLSALALHIDRKSATPVMLHNLIWVIALTLVGTDLIRYTNASSEAWLVLFSSILAFNIGALWSIGPRERRDANLESSGSSLAIVSRPILVILLLVYAAAVIVYLWTIAGRFGIGTLITDPGSIRSAKGQSYLQSVPMVARTALFLGPFLFAVLIFKRSMLNPLRLGGRVLLASGIAVSMALLLQRTTLFMGVQLVIGLYILWVIDQGHSVSDGAARKAMRKTLAVIAISGLVLIGAFQIIGSALGKEGQQALSTGAVSAPLANSGLTSIFHYATSGIPAFLQLVDSENFTEPPPLVAGGPIRVGDYNPQTWGAATFAPLLKLVPIADAPESIAAFIDIGVLTNVFTWNEPLYRDFRIAGVALGMLVIGFTITHMFKYRNRSPFHYWTQALLMSTIFLTTFVMKLNNTLTIATFTLIAFCAISISLQHKTRNRHRRNLTSNGPTHSMHAGDVR